VAVQGKYAYVGINRSVVVVDVSDARRPTPVGQTSFWPDDPHWVGGDVRCIAVSGRYAYVVYEVVSALSNREHSMVVVDVSSPAAPRVIAVYEAEVEFPRKVPSDPWRAMAMLSARARGVAASGAYAYLYHTGGLDVVDVSNPIAPKRIGFWQSHGESGWSPTYRGSHVSVVGKYAYVADRGGGLQVVDISDPTDPKDVGSCQSPGHGVAVVGNYAFAGYERILSIVDVSDPKSPKVVGTYQEPPTTGLHTQAVAAAGKHVFMPFDWPGGGLLVVDVSDPAAPKRVFPGQEASPLVRGRVRALALQGDYTYLGAGPRLVVADISDPKRPKVLGSAEVLPSRLTDVAIDGDYAVVAGGRSGLRVLDVSEAKSPKEVGSFATREAITTVALAGDCAFAGTGGVLHVLDLADPAAPREVATYTMASPARRRTSTVVPAEGPADEVTEEAEPQQPAPETTEPWELVVEEFADDTPMFAPKVAMVGKYACVAAYRTLKVLDLSEPAAPKEVCTYKLDGGSRIAACGGRLVQPDWGGIRVVELSCLAWTTWMPYLIGLAVVAALGLAVVMFRLGRSLHRSRQLRAEKLMQVPTPVWERRKRPSVNGYLWWLMPLALIVVALPLAMLRLVPRAPREVGRCTLGGDARALAVAEDYAYIVGGRSDANTSLLWVVDLSDPRSPRRIGVCKLSDGGWSAWDVAVAGRYAYVAEGLHDLRVVDVADPAAPKVVGSYYTPLPGTSSVDYSKDFNQSVAVAGNYVFVTDGHLGMRVLDVSNPANPKFVGLYDSPLAP
jgi:hypothetical protein